MNCWRQTGWRLAAALWLAASGVASAEPPGAGGRAHSGAEASASWLSGLSLAHYNTWMVLAATMLLGLVAGVVGVFMLLRQRSLLGDVVGHAAVPGICAAFLIGEALWPGQGKWLPGLLLGAIASGSLGAACVSELRKATRLKDDAALGVVLGVFYGLGVALLSVIQKTETGSAAGLKDFLLGQAAAATAADVRLLVVLAVGSLIACTLLFKEFALLAFDERFCASQGWPTALLDLLLTALVVTVSVVGMQTVGLLLMVALLITPAATARFWTDRLLGMTLLAGLFGVLGAALGGMASALAPRLAAGATIVLAGTLLFVLSLLFGRRRGLVGRILTQRRMRNHLERDHLLRALYEVLETTAQNSSELTPSSLVERAAPQAAIAAQRGWSPAQARRRLDVGVRDGLIALRSGAAYAFTPEGAALARQVTRNHRLWEQYLIQYADVAPGRVDREADQIEHVLDPALVDELEAHLAHRYPHLAVPPSPHELEVEPAPAAGAS